MRKYSKLMLFVVIFLLFPVTGKTLLCQNKDLARLQEQASNISYTYDAVESNGNTTFKVTFSSIPKDFVIYYPKLDKWYKTKTSEIVITGLKTNTNYRYDIYQTADNGCEDIPLYTFNVNLPHYNPYHKDALCEGIENYKLCNKWVNVEKYSYEEWSSNVKAYKDSLVVEEKPTEGKETKSSLIEKIVDFYGSIYYIVLPIIIVAGIVGIYVYNKKRELF